MEDTVAEIGIGVTVAILILREVFTFLEKRNGKNGKYVTTALCEEVQKRRDVQLFALTETCERVDNKLEQGFKDVKDLIESKHH